MTKGEAITALGHNYKSGVCQGCGAVIEVSGDTSDAVTKDEITNDDVEVEDVTIVVDQKTEASVGKEASSVVTTIVKETIADDTDVKDLDVVKNNVISADTAQKIKDVIENSDSVEIVATIGVQEKASNDVTTDVKSNVKAEAVAILGAGAKVQYLDVSIVLTAVTEDGTVTLGTMNVLDEEISITVAIPEELKAEGRTYVVIRNHNGVSEGLSTVLNADGTLTFKTDKFSTYAIAYDAPDATVVEYPDVTTDDWFYDAVQYVSANGLMNGVYQPDGSVLFEPETTTTRAMIVTMLYRLDGASAESSVEKFPDVTKVDWFYHQVMWAYENNIVTGYPEGNFGPNDDVTRQQLAAILYRYAKDAGYDVSVSEDFAGFAGYTDADEIQEYAVDAMKWAVENGLINGTTDTTLAPTEGATRAQIATIFMRFCENIVE